MSTRGYLGIKKKGELKGQYNHFDSYISGLGKELILYLNTLNKENMIEILNKTFDYIELIDENSTPTREQILYCKQCEVIDLSVSSQSVSDWYCLLRDTQGRLDLYIDNKCKYMLNGNDFLQDDVFCEYGYVINLDTNKLDIYILGKLKSSYDLLTLDMNKIINDFEGE